MGIWLGKKKGKFFKHNIHIKAKTTTIQFLGLAYITTDPLQNMNYGTYIKHEFLTIEIDLAILKNDPLTYMNTTRS